jgi:hypothetical protein
MITEYIQNSDISDTCVRRDALADVLMTMIGHHPSVLIGDNDTFLRLVQERIIAQPIVTRRESITNIITKLGQTDVETLRTRGYDVDTLVAILNESLKGVTRTGTFRLE